MTDIYLICSDSVFRRMLELELSDCGANVKDDRGAVTAPCAAVVSAPDYRSVSLPEGDGCLTVVFGYPEELEGLDISSSAAVLLRPFAVGELMVLLFGESMDKGAPVLRRRSAADRLSLDARARTVSFSGSSVKLTKREYSLFEYLYERRGKTVPRSEAYKAVWGGGDCEQVVDVYICYLREKVEERFGIKLIKTARGEGYLFEV